MSNEIYKIDKEDNVKYPDIINSPKLLIATPHANFESVKFSVKDIQKISELYKTSSNSGVMDHETTQLMNDFSVLYENLKIDNSLSLANENNGELYFYHAVFFLVTVFPTCL